MMSAALSVNDDHFGLVSELETLSVGYEKQGVAQSLDKVNARPLDHPAVIIPSIIATEIWTRKYVNLARSANWRYTTEALCELTR
jgi:hypothetical protein